MRIFIFLTLFSAKVFGLGIDPTFDPINAKPVDGTWTFRTEKLLQDSIESIQFVVSHPSGITLFGNAPPKGLRIKGSETEGLIQISGRFPEKFRADIALYATADVSKYFAESGLPRYE